MFALMIACEWKREVERTNWATYQQLASLSQKKLASLSHANQKKTITADKMGTFRPCYGTVGPFLTLENTKQSPSEVCVYFGGTFSSSLRLQPCLFFSEKY